VLIFGQTKNNNPVQLLQKAIFEKNQKKHRMTKTNLDINPKAKGLIFDLDGTLADTMPIHYIAWKNAAAKYGIDFTTEIFAKLAGIPLYPTVEKINQIFGTAIDPKEMGDLKEEEFENNMHLTPEIKVVTDLVRKYHGKIPMAVGTGGSRRLSLKSLGIIGLEGYFDILVTSEDVSHFKPHPETFVKCAELMGVAPEDCEVFEDGILGMQAARTAGMMVVDVTEYYEVTIGKE
jgi:beta-phosphoglucomutase family hydrolase